MDLAESDRERADLAEEAYLQAEEEVEQLKAKISLLEQRLADRAQELESKARELALLASDVKLLLGEAGVHRVRMSLINEPDAAIAAALARYTSRAWAHVERPASAIPR